MVLSGGLSGLEWWWRGGAGVMWWHDALKIRSKKAVWLELKKVPVQAGCVTWVGGARPQRQRQLAPRCRQSLDRWWAGWFPTRAAAG